MDPDHKLLSSVELPYFISDSLIHQLEEEWLECQLHSILHSIHYIGEFVSVPSGITIADAFPSLAACYSCRDTEVHEFEILIDFISMLHFTVLTQYVRHLYNPVIQYDIILYKMFQEKMNQWSSSYLVIASSISLANDSAFSMLSFSPRNMSPSSFSMYTSYPSSTSTNVNGLHNPMDRYIVMYSFISLLSSSHSLFSVS